MLPASGMLPLQVLPRALGAQAGTLGDIGACHMPTEEGQGAQGLGGWSHGLYGVEPVLQCYCG